MDYLELNHNHTRIATEGHLCRFICPRTRSLKLSYHDLVSHEWLVHVSFYLGVLPELVLSEQQIQSDTTMKAALII